MAETFDALMKVVIIGDSSVGKTCLILRYTQDLFRQNFLSTIGVDFKTKTVNIGQKCYKLQIWDTAGQERYNTIRKNFYRGARGVVLVYDVTNQDSFASLTRWTADIAENIGEGLDKPVILILGNKIDKETERVIDTVAGQTAAQEFGTQFAEVSALSGLGVNEAFSGLVQEMARVLESQNHRERAYSIRLSTSYPDGDHDSTNRCC